MRLLVNGSISINSDMLITNTLILLALMAAMELLHVLNKIVRLLITMDVVLIQLATVFVLCQAAVAHKEYFRISHQFGCAKREIMLIGACAHQSCVADNVCA